MSEQAPPTTPEDFNGIFIDIEFDEPARSDAELAKKLEEVCTVDIFRATENGTEIVRENLDECVLCYFCEKAAPEGSLRIIKRYEQ
jgi:NAD-dependent dihydropyrimidine dehydrogenase PreA subunit